jgi:hypothetical protein
MGCCNTKRPEPSELDLLTIERHGSSDDGEDPTQHSPAEQRKELQVLSLAAEEGRLPLSTPTFGQVFRFEAEEEHTFGQAV